MNNCFYLSHYINEHTPLYGGQKTFTINDAQSIARGDSSNSKTISLSNHTGTHIDFPQHFSENGKTLDDYPADFWFFKSPYSIYHDAVEDELIDFENVIIDAIPKVTDFLIVKTGFQKYRYQAKYWENNPGLKPSLAGRLKSRCKGLKTIGMDLISISGFQNRTLGRKAHRQFLIEHDILIIEDMNLLDLTSDIHEIYCFPLLIESIDGVPVTVIGVDSE